MWCVCDVFGNPWGDVVETLTEAQEQLRELRNDLAVRTWEIELEIVRWH